MAYDFNGKQIATTQSGYLENFEDWTEELAIDMAKADGLFTESLCAALAQCNPNSKEGLRAFLEKRNPSFGNK